ncbi:MAG: ubiquinone/menaquinone biosynthesis C-methylase UbiE [Mariniblastus sp.]
MDVQFEMESRGGRLTADRHWSLERFDSVSFLRKNTVSTNRYLYAFRLPNQSLANRGPQLGFCKRLIRLCFFFAVVFPLIGTSVAVAQTTLEKAISNTDVPDAIQGITDLFDNQEPQSDKQASKIPAGVKVYMGRRVAQTMHYAGAEWLIRDEREREERCSLMLANLGLRPGMTVCDMGCGNGFHSLSMAKMVGAEGTVVGVDVQPEMLGFMRERMEDQGLENVIPILGSYHNPHLPTNTLDMVLMVDVYHEFSHPAEMLKAIRKSLKPDGVVVLVEYREEDPKVPIKALHKMSKAQVNLELEANGFKLVKEFDKLPWQHMMFFGKSESN